MIFHPMILGQLHLQSIEYAEYLQRTFESYDSRCFLILKYKGYKRNQRSALCVMHALVFTSSRSLFLDIYYNSIFNMYVTK